jgi:hypothetical protein
MAASSPLKGMELVDCAKANAKQGLQTAATQCGYGNDLDGFSHALQKACAHMGIEIEGLSDLNAPPQISSLQGEIIAPDSPSEL